VRRVWKRLGLIKNDNVRGIHAVAAEMHPAYPGALDLPTWTVGRGWCHAARPDCKGAAAGKPCPLEKCCCHRRSNR
jgi:endonuclease III